MVKKISYIIIAAAILVTGYYALGKLNYWQRSVWIFKMNNSEQGFEGRGDREHGEFFGRPAQENLQGFERRGGRQISDSARRQFEARGGRPDMRRRNVPDSLRRQQFPGNEGGQTGTPPSERRFRDGEGRGRGDFRSGNKIYLKNVYWFLAAFAAFTVIMIYLDRAYCMIFGDRKKS
jgi:hypothetical protein